MSLMDEALLDNYFEVMKEEGVVLCREAIALENIILMRNEIAHIKTVVMEKIKDMPRPLRTYSDIAERHLGRFDYRCGFNAKIFELVEKPIVRFVQSLSPTIHFKHYWGAIPSQGNSGPTNMHRDVYPLVNTVTGENLSSYDINLPTYYFTVLIPLVKITKENGPTAFIKSSHTKAIVDKEKSEIYAPLLLPGDFIVFDGRTLHQGMANQSNQERLVAYITFVANWYHDQTFTINDYLFPELK